MMQYTRLQCANNSCRVSTVRVTSHSIDAWHMTDGMQHALFMQPVAREEAPAPWLSSRPRAHMNTQVRCAA